MLFNNLYTKQKALKRRKTKSIKNIISKLFFIEFSFIKFILSELANESIINFY